MAEIPNRDELEARLARKLGRLQREQLTRLLEELGDPPRIENVAQDFWDQVGKEFAAVLAPLLEEIYLEQARALMEAQPVGVDWALVNQAAIEFATNYAQELSLSVNKTSMEAAQRAVADYFSRGQTIGELRNILSGIFGPIRAETIAVTEVTHAAAFGEYQIAKDLRAEGVDMIPSWVTNNDEKVCPICRPLNDRKADGFDGLGFPYWIHPRSGKRYQQPGHPRCRCWPRHELK